MTKALPNGQNVSQRKKCLIWNRVSTSEQIQGLEKQLSSSKELAKELGFDFIDIYQPVSESAKSEGKEFRKMIKKLKDKRNGYDGLIVEYLDRLSRSTPVGARIIRQLRELGIYFYTVREKINTENETDVFNCDLLFSRAEQENSYRKSKSVSSTTYWLNQGYWTAPVPIGYQREYRYPKKDIRSKEIFPTDDAALIKLGFELFDKGYQINELSLAIRKRGLDVSEKRWGEILRRPLYAGYVKHNLLGEDTMVKGKHEPIISKNLFDRVQKKLKKREGKRTIGETKNEFLKGIVCCPKCGNTLTNSPRPKKNKTYYYYKCYTKGCNYNISAPMANESFTLRLSNLKLDSSYNEMIKTLTKEIYEEELNLTNKVSPKLKEEISKLKKRIEAIHDSFFDGDIDAVFRDQQILRNQNKLNELEGELNSHNEVNYNTLVEEVIKSLKDLPVLWESMKLEDLRHLQKNLVDKAIINKEKKVIKLEGLIPLFKAS